MGVARARGQDPSRTAASQLVRQRLASGTLVCDGAMGTMLHGGGVSLDRSLPELNVSHPELVGAIHRAYLAAGAQVIETNTFGASRVRLARFDQAHRVAELNLAGARLARQAVRNGAPGTALVAGSIGPVSPAGLGQRVAPRALRDAFREQVEALVDGGVDLLIFETFGNLAELVEGVSVATAVADVPIVAQMTFVEDGRTLGGDSPEEVATTLGGLGVAALGANCTLGPQGLLEVLEELARWSNLPLAAQPNAGPPTLVGGHFQYAAADPAYFARHARRFIELGATLVGGCCGTTPAHIQAVADAVGGQHPVAQPRRAASTHAQGSAPDVRVADISEPRSTSVLERARNGELIVVCELPSPATPDAHRAVDDAQRLRDAGSHAVIVGPVGSTRAQMSPASIALMIQQRVPGIEVILTATTWEKSLMVLQADLLGTYAFGIRHVLCRTGTPPLQGDYPNAAGVWDVDSLGLMDVLRGLNAGRDYNGIPIGRPTGFVVGARVNPAASDFAREVEIGRRKLASGAHFLVTPPVYDVDRLEHLVTAIGPPPSVPVLLGVMPLQDARHAEYLRHEVPEMVVPEGVLRRMAEAGESGPLVGRQITLDFLGAARQRVPIGGVVASSASGSATELAALVSALGGAVVSAR